MRLSPLPVTSRSAPCTVVCMPTMSAGSIMPGTTWYVRIDERVAESVLSASMVAGSIFAKASSTGANTVNSLPFRVSTRLTSGLSLPLTADTRVVRSGLLDAATATGSCDMPSTEPAPLGTASAYAWQPEPTRLAAGSIVSAVIDGDDSVVGAEDDIESSVVPPALELHADRASAAAKASESPAARWVFLVSMSSSVFGDRCGPDGHPGAPGGAPLSGVHGLFEASVRMDWKSPEMGLLAVRANPNGASARRTGRG